MAASQRTIAQETGMENKDTNTNTNTNTNTMLAILNHRVETMHSGFLEMRTILSDLTKAVNRLAVFEERQAQFAEAQARAFKVIADAEKRIASLEKRVPEDDRVRNWVDRLATAAVGLVFLLVLKGVGLI